MRKKKPKPIYAIYKGDDFLFMGTLKECADYQKEYEYLNKVFWQKDDQTNIFEILGSD